MNKYIMQREIEGCGEFKCKECNMLLKGYNEGELDGWFAYCLVFEKLLTMQSLRSEDIPRSDKCKFYFK